MAFPESIRRVFRQFKRYTGDGLAGEPANAPLPVGDPSSGVHSPKKNEIIDALEELYDTAIAETQADLAIAAAEVAVNAVSSVTVTSFATVAAAEAYAPELVAPSFLKVEGYSAPGDGGAALYKKVSNEPAHEGKFMITLDDGVTTAWYELAERQISVCMLGASVGSSEADNLAALEAAMGVIDAQGAGGIFIPAGINYGYDLEDPATYPNMIAKAAAISVDFVIHDFGVGNTYAPPSKDGPQERIFFYHVETSPPGMHDGNILIINGDWPPGLVINNHAQLAAVGDPSRTASDNRRCHIFFFNDGFATWRIGQGANTGADLTDDELSALVIAVNGVPDLGISDLTSVIQVLKTNLNMRLDVSKLELFFRNTGTSKVRSMTTSQSTDVLEIWGNANNTVQWDVGTGTTTLDPAVSLAVNASTKLRFLRNGDVIPAGDNTQAFGSTANRWHTLYAGTPSINTSDANAKTGVVAALDDAAALRAVRRVDLVRFQWKDAILEKGADGARLHFGVIAQQVKEAFEAEGLDAFRYGLLCYDEWDDQFDEVHEQAKDAAGNLLWDDQGDGTRVPRVEIHRQLRLAAGSRYGVRYDELWALMLADLRQQLAVAS